MGPEKVKRGTNLSKRSPFCSLKGREKVGCVKAKLVVAHPGVERNHASRGLTEFDRIARGFRIDRANSIRADAHGQLAADRGTDIESIQLVERRIGFRSGNMNLAGSVLHYARGEGKQIANIPRCGIGDVDDLRSIEGALVGDLVGIDSRGGRMHIHLFAHYLFMGQHHFNDLPMSICLALQALVEARLLHIELIGQILV